MNWIAEIATLEKNRSCSVKHRSKSEEAGGIGEGQGTNGCKSDLLRLYGGPVGAELRGVLCKQLQIMRNHNWRLAGTTLASKLSEILWKFESQASTRGDQSLCTWEDRWRVVQSS